MLEIVDEDWGTAWLDRWASRLGSDSEVWRSRVAGLDLAGIGTGDVSEAGVRAAYQDALGVSDAEVEAMFADMWDAYCGRLDDDLMGYVASLRPTYRLAIISNSGDGARREEERRYGFSRIFDPIIYSHEVGLEKPDPAIFELTCRRMDVAPERTVFVDDVPANVAAAQALGMHGINHTHTPTTITTLTHLLS